MDWYLQREKSHDDWMTGTLVADQFVCATLEDELRQVKVDKETAIPANRNEVVMEDSPKFGPDTLTLVDVEGFKHIRIHSGNDDDQTEGCILVGNQVVDRLGRISGGKTAGVLDKLKDIYRAARDRGERVYLTIKNAPGARYVDSGEVVSV